MSQQVQHANARTYCADNRQKKRNEEKMSEELVKLGKI